MSPVLEQRSSERRRLFLEEVEVPWCVSGGLMLLREEYLSWGEVGF